MLGLLSFIIHLPALFPTSYAYIIHQQFKNAIEHHLGTSVQDQLTALELKHSGNMSELLEKRQALIDDDDKGWFSKQWELKQNFHKRKDEEADFLREKREIYAHHVQEQALYDGGGAVVKKSKELTDFVEVKGTNAMLRTLGIDKQFLDVTNDETHEVVTTAADVLHSFVISATTLVGWASFSISITMLAKRILVKIERDDLLKRMTWNKTYAQSVSTNLQEIEKVLRDPNLKMVEAYMCLSKYLGDNFEKCYHMDKKKCYKHEKKNCTECSRLKVSDSLAIVFCDKLVRNLTE